MLSHMTPLDEGAEFYTTDGVNFDQLTADEVADFSHAVGDYAKYVSTSATVSPRPGSVAVDPKQSDFCVFRLH